MNCADFHDIISILKPLMMESKYAMCLQYKPKKHLNIKY